MAKRLECDCGHAIEAVSDDELVASAQHHARATHGMELPARRILTEAFPISDRAGAEQ